MRDRDAIVRRRLLRWYRDHARDLPWRRRSDAYAIWVSEVMLQQTRVEAVVDHYNRFLERFPTLDALAGAAEDDVLACWSGLGYYRRAKNMRAAAEEIERRHDGAFPRCVLAARALPGVGDYTAGAVASIAYGERVPAVDGNVRRVLARVFAVGGPMQTGEGAARIRALASRLADGPSPGDWNQAVMELGATVCLSRAPRCEVCPLSGGACVAESAGAQADYPSRTVRPKPIRESLAALLVVRRGRVLLVRDQEEALAKDVWEAPWARLDRARTSGTRSLARAIGRRLGLRMIGRPQLVGTVRHAVMNRSLTVDAWVAEGSDSRKSGRVWVSIRNLDGRPVSSLARKLVRLIPGAGLDDPAEPRS